MVITRSPLKICLGGGGTDFSSYLSGAQAFSPLRICIVVGSASFCL